MNGLRHRIHFEEKRAVRKSFYDSGAPRSNPISLEKKDLNFHFTVELGSFRLVMGGFPVSYEPFGTQPAPFPVQAAVIPRRAGEAEAPARHDATPALP
jgi:hypothetical protein